MMETWISYIKHYGNYFFIVYSIIILLVESTGALVSGALAGTFAKTMLYPLDLVRHRQQVGFALLLFDKNC